MPNQPSRDDSDLKHLPEFLEGVVEAAGAWDAVMSTVDLDRQRFVREPIGCNSGHHGLQHWYRFIGDTPWLSDHRSFADVGSIMRTDDIIDRMQLSGTSFYRKCLRPHGIASGLIMVVERSGGEITWLHLLQDGPDDGSGAARVALLNSLHPLLVETLRISRHMGELEALRDNFVGVIDHVSAGMALVTDRQVTCNQTAKSVLAEQDGLQLAGHQLKASGDQHAALQDLIDNARKGASGDMAITRPSGKPALHVSVRAVAHGGHENPAAGAAVAICIVDPGRRRPPSTTHLRQAFGLTRAEADIATYLAYGRSAADIASGLGISVDTVRGHIKVILTKTRTSRQAELVALIANPPII